MQGTWEPAEGGIELSYSKIRTLTDESAKERSEGSPTFPKEISPQKLELMQTNWTYFKSSVNLFQAQAQSRLPMQKKFSSPLS